MIPKPPSRSPSSLRMSMWPIGSSSEAAWGRLPGLKPGPWSWMISVMDVGVDAVGDPQHEVGVLAVAPLDGVAAHLHDGLLQVLDLPVGQRGVGEQVGEHVVGLLEVGQLAADVEVDLAVRAAASGARRARRGPCRWRR